MDERKNQQNRQQQQQSGQKQQGQSQVSGLGDSDAARGSGQQQGQEKWSQQQGGQSGTRQQQQFDRGTSQQGGGGTTSRFADQIREHMEVVDDMGRHCGTVDHVEGDRIKLSRSDSPDGKHHYVSMSQVSGIKDGKVCLRERGDNDFGMESGA